MPGFIINRSGGPAPTTPGRRDWLRSHRFELINFFGSTPSNSPEFIALKDVTMPDKKIKNISVETPGTTYKFASQAEYSDLIMIFYGSRDLLVKCLQMADKPHNTREGIRDYNQYMGNVTFQIRDTGSFDGAFSGIEYDYINAWISSVSHGQVSYSSSEIMMITVNIVFSFFNVTIFGDGGLPVVANDVVSPLLGYYNGEGTSP